MQQSPSSNHLVSIFQRYALVTQGIMGRSNVVRFDNPNPVHSYFAGNGSSFAISSGYSPLVFDEQSLERRLIYTKHMAHLCPEAFAVWERALEDLKARNRMALANI